MIFFVHEQVDHIDRQVLTLVDIIIETGGLLSLVYTILAAFMTPIQENMFYRSLLRKSYYVREEDQKQLKPH